MDFGWTMIGFGKIYPCRSVIVSTLILAPFFTASTLLQVDATIPSNKYILQSHLRVLFTMKRIIIILTTYNIGRYNIDNNNK